MDKTEQANSRLSIDMYVSGGIVQDIEVLTGETANEFFDKIAAREYVTTLVAGTVWGTFKGEYGIVGMVHDTRPTDSLVFESFARDDDQGRHELFMGQIEHALTQLLRTIGIENPENLDDIVAFVGEDVSYSADPDNWQTSDVAKGFKRWLESQR
jgi:hypothetical protein